MQVKQESEGITNPIRVEIGFSEEGNPKVVFKAITEDVVSIDFLIAPDIGCFSPFTPSYPSIEIRCDVVQDLMPQEDYEYGLIQNLISSKREALYFDPEKNTTYKLSKNHDASLGQIRDGGQSEKDPYYDVASRSIGRDKKATLILKDSPMFSVPRKSETHKASLTSMEIKEAFEVWFYAKHFRTGEEYYKKLCHWDIQYSLGFEEIKALSTLSPLTPGKGQVTYRVKKSHELGMKAKPDYLVVQGEKPDEKIRLIDTDRKRDSEFFKRPKEEGKEGDERYLSEATPH
ncbi:Uncharacterised protein [Legionella steigerwaltii]|uniref:Uncharacterized protein n=1 Tax=Legionella steigerwaltii TaxID=460 RepID=A0A378L7E2_9GAMM|nr:hypothetical protein [Legionella steigerwaltii]KTD69919.1 hypothetical protein Lstg_3360 [Legionella steigerwaltii]STY21768.1 Uncharacterised protein [Legionella steigerwaltii]